MNVFVLNTGRCGSTTFVNACKHITNYSSGHETRSKMLHLERLNYPNNHIEADNRLSWVLGRLDKQFGDRAFYVHLKRNDCDTARSFSNRYSTGIIKAYREAILMGLPGDIDPMAVSLDYCETVNSNIELFLKDKSKKIVLSLENIDHTFKEFWNMISAEGDINAAISEFRVRYNATRQPDMHNPALFVRIAHKFQRLVAKFPAYIRNS